MMTKFCRYSCRTAGKTCCWLCDKRCRFACTKECSLLARHRGTVATLERLPAGRKVIITYSVRATLSLSRGVDQKWRSVPGVVIARAKGPGPRNVLVWTEQGRVVVPYGNVRWVK